MAVCFLDAAKRHYDDADHLYNNNRKANAGALYGLAAECAVKSWLVQKNFVATDVDGDIDFKEKAYRTHINQLIPAIQTLANSRSDSSDLAWITDFSDWAVEHRYYCETDLPVSLEKWKAAAKNGMSMLDAMK